MRVTTISAIVLAMGLEFIFPFALAISGYLAFFNGLAWYYPFGILVGFLITGFTFAKIADTVEARTNDGRMGGVQMETTMGAFGWVWLLSIPVSIWFFVSAIFFEGSWWEFVYSFIVGGIAKGTARSFKQSIIERERIKNLFSPEK